MFVIPNYKASLKKNEFERIHLEKHLLKSIPIVFGVFFIASILFNCYLYLNQPIKYWYVLFGINSLYLFYTAIITIKFKYGFHNAFEQIYGSKVYSFLIKFWIKNYINKTTDIIEKKYKILLFDSWIYNEGVYLNINLKENYFWKKIIESTDYELNNKGYDGDLHLRYAYAEEAKLEYYLKNDSIKNVEIAKKIYEEYIFSGMSLHSALNNDNDADTIFMLQNYSLYSPDIRIIQSLLK